MELDNPGLTLERNIVDRADLAARFVMKILGQASHRHGGRGAARVIRFHVSGGSLS